GAGLHPALVYSALSGLSGNLYTSLLRYLISTYHFLLNTYHLILIKSTLYFKVNTQKNLLLPDQALQYTKVFGKFFPAQCSNLIRSFCFLTHKFFFYGNVFIFFKCSNMTGQVAISDVQQFLHLKEIDPIIYHQHGHDTQPDPAFKFFIE